MLRRIAVALLAPILVTSCHRGATATIRPSVILISIDTLRSDHLPLYGYRSVSTPNIDRLAADAIVFDHAYSNVPLTLPSHTTIMTGLLPAEHGVRDNAGNHLAPSVPTIASVLHSAGYATGAAVSAYVLRRDSNISSGFDFYDDNIPFIEGAPTGNLQRDGVATGVIARRWIATHPSQPFFLFVHLFEPHAPYEPSYDGEIAKADRIVGDILANLRRRGLYDNAVIILLSDHGEGLGDHGEQEHGVLLYREALQVPLIVKLPERARAGQHVSAAAQLVDVFPTIMDALHIAPPANLRGRSLLRPATSERPIFSETLYPRIHLGWSDLRSLIRYPMHLIDGPKPELYDLASDSHEQNETRDSRRHEYADAQRDLAAFPQRALQLSPVDAEERRKLAALGYVSATTHIEEQPTLNPREHLGDLAELKAVTELMARRDYADAARRMEALLLRNPGWSDLRDDLGVAYQAVGDLAGAERTYRDAIRITPELAPEFALSLASILLEEEKLDDAEAHAKIALTADPAGAHEVLARIAAARHDYDGALREAAEMRKFPAHSLDADFLVAQIEAAKGDYTTAVIDLQDVYRHASEQRVPLPRRYWFVTGDTFARMGRTSEAQLALERAIAADPKARESYIALAFAQQAGGDLTAAKATLERMATAIPESRGDVEAIERRWKK